MPAFRDYGQLTCVHVPQQALKTQQVLVCAPASQSSQLSIRSRRCNRKSASMLWRRGIHIESSP
jgi:hypothetical protein